MIRYIATSAFIIGSFSSLVSNASSDSVWATGAPNAQADKIVSLVQESGDQSRHDKNGTEVRALTPCKKFQAKWKLRDWTDAFSSPSDPPLSYPIQMKPASKASTIVQVIAKVWPGIDRSKCEALIAGFLSQPDHFALLGTHAEHQVVSFVYPQNGFACSVSLDFSPLR